MILRSLIHALVLASLSVPAVSQDGPTAATGTDTAEVYQTRHNRMLSFPKHLWNILVYPIGQFTIWAEAKGLFTRGGKEETAGWFPYVVFGGETGTGEETGFGGGLNLFRADLFGRGNQFSANLIANRSNYSGNARYGDPGVGGGPWFWNATVEALGTRYEKATINGEGESGGPGERFDFQRRDVRLTLGRHSNYGETEGYEPDAIVELRLAYGFRQYDDTGRESSGIAGANEAIDLFSVGGRTAYDDRDFKPPTRSISHPLNYQFPGRVLLFADGRYYSFRDTAFPERGGLIQIEADYVAGSRNVRYVQYVTEVQRFFTLFYSNRILALRARLDKAHPLGNDGIIPYSDLNTLGGGQRLRGYKRGFFRGQGSLLFSAEYRYPIWDTWNAFLFVDEGQVFETYGDLEPAAFKYSFGGGISVRTERAFLFGLRVARSEEEKALVGLSLEKDF